MSIPFRPHRGRTIYCVIRNTDGEVMGMYKERQDAMASCEPFKDSCRVESYVQKPNPKR